MTYYILTIIIILLLLIILFFLLKNKENKEKHSETTNHVSQTSFSHSEEIYYQAISYISSMKRDEGRCAIIAIAITYQISPIDSYNLLLTKAKETGLPYNSIGNIYQLVKSSNRVSHIDNLDGTKSFTDLQNDPKYRLGEFLFITHNHIIYELNGHIFDNENYFDKHFPIIIISLKFI